MPCMGPDQNYARQRGNEVGKDLLEELINHHLVMFNALKMWDITADECKKQDFVKLPNAEKRWNKAKKMFVKAVEELFVEDAANGF